MTADRFLDLGRQVCPPTRKHLFDGANIEAFISVVSVEVAESLVFLELLLHEVISRHTHARIKSFFIINNSFSS